MPSIPHPQVEQPATIRLLPHAIAEEDSPLYDPSPPPKREPFAMIPQSVFDLHDGHALAVYAVLARHADTAGQCWPSLRTIIESTGWSKSTVRRTISILTNADLVTIEHRTSNEGDADTNRYTLTHHPLRGGVTGDPPRISETPRVGRLRHHGGVTGDPKLYPRERDPINEIPPTPQNGLADDFRPTYRDTLGVNWQKAIDMFRQLAPEFTNGAVTTLLVDVERDVGPLPRDVLKDGLFAASESLKRRLMSERQGGKSIEVLKPYARKVISSCLKEANA